MPAHDENLALASLPFPSWVPADIVDGYKEKGIVGLFEWQSNLLDEYCSSPMQKNLVYTAPTSAGKSLVADLLALRSALSGKRVVFVLPYIALAKEKLRVLQNLWRRVDIELAGFIGPHSTATKDWNAAVCTIEKANSLFNRLFVEECIEDIGAVVLDELHMIADGSRGYTLESFITKLLYFNTRQRNVLNEEIAVIGMSATMLNLNAVSKWIGTESRFIDFRPVKLCERICSEKKFIKVDDLKVDSSASYPQRFVLPDDPDGLFGLCAEAVYQRKLTLVFCSSKAEVEKVALSIAKVLDFFFKKDNDLLAKLDKDGLWSMKTKLEESSRELDTILAKTLPRAVGYHHAGLTSEERECLEDGFRAGTLWILVATSTLSSGVNLPAHRVIIRAQSRGPAAINYTTYHQMAGRAGRMGQATEGESFLLIRPADFDVVTRLIKDNRSSRERRDPARLILEGVCTGLVATKAEAVELMECMISPPSTTIDDALEALSAQHMLVVESSASEKDSENGDESASPTLVPTQLGRATLASSLIPELSRFVFNDLMQSMRMVALDTDLHLLYLVTPSNATIWNGCDWNRLHNVFSTLPLAEARVARMIGINDAFIMRLMRGITAQTSDVLYQQHLRFFSALALQKLVNEVPLSKVAADFGVPRGSLQTLQQQSATYSAMVVAFCSRLGWLHLVSLLEGFASRLEFCVRPELTELVRIKGMDGVRARVFHDRGVTSIAQLARCDEKKVSTLLSAAVKFDHSFDDVLGHQEWLSCEEKMSLQAAAELLIERAQRSVEEKLQELGIAAPRLDAVLRFRKADSDISATQQPSVAHSGLEEVPVMVDPLKSSDSVEVEVEPDAENENNSPLHAVPPEVVKPESPDVMTDSEILTAVRKTCSQISSQSMEDEFEDSCIELFSESFRELSLHEGGSRNHLNVSQSSVFVNELDDEVQQEEVAALPSPRASQSGGDADDSCDVVFETDGELDDLETSMLVTARAAASNSSFCVFNDDDRRENEAMVKKISQKAHTRRSLRLSIAGNRSFAHDSFCDSFDEPIVVQHIGGRRSKRVSVASRRSLKDSFYDSFDDPITQKSYRQQQDAANTSSVSNISADIFASPKQCGSTHDDMVPETSTGGDSGLGSSSGLSGMSNETGGSWGRMSPSMERILDQIPSAESGRNAAACSKRRRSKLQVQPSTPTTSSPATKLLRQVQTKNLQGGTEIFKYPAKPPATLGVEELNIDDVCRNESVWNYFVQKSKCWTEVGVGLMITGISEKPSPSHVLGISLCTRNADPCFIPISDSYSAENEENDASSCTANDSISLNERRDVISAILSKATVYLYHGIRAAELLRENGIRVGQVVCLRYMSFLTELRHGDFPMKLTELLRHAKLLPTSVPFNERQRGRCFSATVAALMLRLYDFLLPLALQEGTEESTKLEIDSITVISGISSAGLQFDVVASNTMESKIRADMERLENECHALAGRRFNIESAQQVSDLLFNKLRLPFPGGARCETKSHYSTSRAVLEKMATQHPIVEKIIAYRRVKFALKNCLKPLKSAIVGRSDDVVKTEFEMCNGNGRFMSHEPNLQGLTKGDIYEDINMRNLLVARKGCKLIAADYCQMELRVLAHLSQDPYLMKLVSDDGRDFFADLSQQWGYPRQSVKLLCYGIIYGIGAKSFTEVASCTESEAEALMKSFFKTFPKVRAFLNATKERIRQGSVKTMLGRIRRSTRSGNLEEKARDERQLVNYTISATASELVKMALLRMTDKLKERHSQVVLAIHDEIIIECPTAAVEDVRKMVIAAMETPYPGFSVPLKVKTTVGSKWGELGG